MRRVGPCTDHGRKVGKTGSCRCHAVQQRPWPLRDEPPLCHMCLATVSSTTESSTASSACRASGTKSRSPGDPFQESSPAVRDTLPCKICTVASPGFSCSLNRLPARSAIMVWRMMCSCPPNTVAALRPLEAFRAISSWWRISAVNDTFCMMVSLFRVGAFMVD